MYFFVEAKKRIHFVKKLFMFSFNLCILVEKEKNVAFCYERESVIAYSMYLSERTQRAQANMSWLQSVGSAVL